MYGIYQKREIYASRFYSRFNENKLIQELYSVTHDSKYLLKRNENFGEMQNEFDSLFYYCKQSDDYCNRLDSSRNFLDMYFNKFVPKNDSILGHLDFYKSENIELPRIRPEKGVLRIDTLRLNISAKSEIKNLLAENLNILEKRIIEPTQWIVKSDRNLTKSNQKIIDARIKSYHVWQKIVLILTLGMIFLLLIDLALILISPIEKPQPLYNTLPNLQYSAINDSFEDDLIHLLQSNKDLFLKYIQINLVFPRGSFFPIEIISAFQKFSYDINLKFDVHDKLKNENLTEKMAFVLLEDETMVHLLEASEKKNLVVGEQVGILAYGDSPLKRVVADGITVIDPTYQDSEETGFLYKKTTGKSNIRFIKRNSL